MSVATETKVISEVFIPTSLRGKVHHLRDFKSEALLPVFEAVVNAIQAIEEKGPVAEGQIKVTIKRDRGQMMIPSSGEASLPDIVGFEIEDNGIGFNDENFKSFETSDSTYKMAKGGKGVGRFFWLKAFDRVGIESVYQDTNRKFSQRRIEFSLTEGIVENKEPTDVVRTGARVSLVGFQEEYRKQPTAYRTSKKIAQRIFEHCLTRFITGLTPAISVVDDFDGLSISLQALYDDLKEYVTKDEFHVKNHDFKIFHLRLYDTRAETHKLVFCADSRDVESKSIASLLGTSMQFDDEGKKFFYSAYITSSLLDSRVDPYRQDFNIPKESDMYDDSGVSMTEIEDRAVEKAKLYLGSILRVMETQKSEKIARLVQNEVPMLRAVLKYCPEAAREIELNTPDEKTEEILYKYKGRAEHEIKKRSAKLLKTQPQSIEEIESQYKELTEKLEDFQKDQLAGYVVFRKMIIDLLDKKLRLNTEGHYSNEDIVHDIVFPRKTDSDTIRYEDHNLWLIDEVLAFHTFARSDKPISDGGERPDVVIFSEVGDNRVARAVSLLEFKKPERKTFDEDPTRQLFRYVRDIRKNGIRLSTGRRLTADDATRFYCYVICDLTPQIQEFAENGNYAKLQGEFGYYTYNRNHNAHVEIIAFDKIVLDAKQRHKAFFKKLGIA